MLLHIAYGVAIYIGIILAALACLLLAAKKEPVSFGTPWTFATTQDKPYLYLVPDPDSYCNN